MQAQLKIWIAGSIVTKIVKLMKLGKHAGRRRVTGNKVFYHEIIDAKPNGYLISLLFFYLSIYLSFTGNCILNLL